MVDDTDDSATSDIQALTISNANVLLSNRGLAKLPAIDIGFSGSFNNLTNISWAVPT